MGRGQTLFQSHNPLKLMKVFLTAGHVSLTSPFAIKSHLQQTEQRTQTLTVKYRRK